MNSLRRHAVGLVAAMCVIVTLGSTARPAQARAHVYLFHGIMSFLSLGMDDLAADLKLQGVDATVYSFTDWQMVAAQAAAAYRAGTGKPIVLVGHSLGANSAMHIADALEQEGVPVALVVLFDGTDTYSAPKNVSRLLNFTRYFLMRPGPGFTGTLSNVDLRSDPNITHLNIDRTPKLQARVVNEILAAIGATHPPSLPGPGARPPLGHHVSNGAGAPAKPGSTGTAAARPQGNL